MWVLLSYRTHASEFLLSSTSGSLSPLESDGWCTNYEGNAGSNLSQMLNCRLDEESLSFFRPPTLHFLEIGTWRCVPSAVGMPNLLPAAHLFSMTSICCLQGWQNGTFRGLCRYQECSNSLLKFNWQKEAPLGLAQASGFALIINNICYW